MMKHLSIYSFILSASIVMSGCSIFNSTTDNSTIISKDIHRGENSTITIEQSTEQKKEKKSKKKKSSQKDSKNNKSTVVISSNILNGKWIIYSAKDKITSGDERPYMIFDESTKSMYGNNGCNTLNANYKISNSTILEFSNVLSTQRYCHDAQYEVEINDAIANVKSIKIEEFGNEYYMTFLNSANQPLMVLRKPNLDFINGTWKITKVNNTQCKNKDYELAIDLSELKVHGKVGCNIVNGSLLLDAGKPNSIMFLDLISTKMSCPDMQLETEILIALEKTESYKRGKDNKTLTLFDKDNKAVLEFLNTTANYQKKD